MTSPAVGTNPVTTVPGVNGNEVRAWIEAAGDERSLHVSALDAADLAGLEGTIHREGELLRLRGTLSHPNAIAVRKIVPVLRPRPVGLATSAGTGDRLGLATAGHAAAFREHGAGLVPVFGQQSVREMERLGRPARSVVDDATFGALEAGWALPVGTDADHLRSTADIDVCLDAGFTSFTLDPGDAVTEVGERDPRPLFDALPWAELDDDPNSLLRRYAGRTFDIDGERLTITSEDVTRAAAKYARALALTASMHRHLRGAGVTEADIEFAVDETREVTTPAEHFYLASELARLEVDFVGFAPRYIGSFLKGVEYVGDLGVLRESLTTHARIARTLGPYKLSLHTGSDKFAIYDLVAEATQGLVHLKTSGTSYLAALEIVATANPQLFREIYATSLNAYAAASASYPVDADLARTPSPSQLTDAELPGILHAFDTRQILHVAYGAVLHSPEGLTPHGHQLREVITASYGDYVRLLADHLGAHLAPFAKVATVTA